MKEQVIIIFVIICKTFLKISIFLFVVDKLVHKLKHLPVFNIKQSKTLNT